HQARKWHAVQAVTVEIVAAAALDPVKMKKDQRITSVDLHCPVTPFEAAIGKTPRRQIGAEMFDDVDAGKHFRHPVKIALVSEAIAFHVHVVITPLNAALAPPSQDGHAIVAFANADPAHVVKSEPVLALQSPGETMRNDAECGVLHFIVDRLGRGKEEQVAVEIGHPLHIGLAVQNEQYPGWRTSEEVFD